MCTYTYNNRVCTHSTRSYYKIVRRMIPVVRTARKFIRKYIQTPIVCVHTCTNEYETIRVYRKYEWIHTCLYGVWIHTCWQILQNSKKRKADPVNKKRKQILQKECTVRLKSGAGEHSRSSTRSRRWNDQDVQEGVNWASLKINCKN
jgi:hypothetical protein